VGGPPWYPVWYPGLFDSEAAQPGRMDPRLLDAFVLDLAIAGFKRLLRTIEQRCDLPLGVALDDNLVKSSEPNAGRRSLRHVVLYRLRRLPRTGFERDRLELSREIVERSPLRFSHPLLDGGEGAKRPQSRAPRGKGPLPGRDKPGASCSSRAKRQ